ncbi:MAG TPA: mismatch repair protein [Terriglobales bacterium]|nr:mismatch repair protein [Terriglobales bacterium]
MQALNEYRQCLRDRESRVAQLDRLHLRFGNFRLAVAIAAAILACFIFGRHTLSEWWLAAPLAAFAALAFAHSRALRARSRAQRAAMVYANGIARIEDRWAGTGDSGDAFNDPHHVYASDLDLFGHGSVFELLSTARTRMGSATLARWLGEPASTQEVLQRHEALAELSPRLDLREDIAILGEDASVGVHPAELLEWAEAPVAPAQRWLRIAAGVLAVAFVGAAVFWWISGVATPLLIVFLTEAYIAFRFRKRVEVVTHAAEHAFHDLDLLSAVLARIEREPVESALLRRLKEKLESHHSPASRAISRLRGIVDLVMSRDNLVLRVLDVPLMYSVQVMFAVESWQREHGAAVRSWLDAVGEFEALLSLAAYTYEHDQDVFPEFVSGAACFEAEHLGHPLIPAAKCVLNSPKICGEVRTLLVSGSNMSGKSTLLRAVGIASVMAMAGAPVRARRLRMTPLQVGASIRINDSLQEGSSRFYAEITRLRNILDLTGGELPVLYLIDEMLQGTNSHDRRIGAEGVVRALVERGAIGLITTHDLALTEIGSSIGEHLRNVHFQDELENGKIQFDYKLREGVVTKSNGLELMRSIGLNV